MGGKCSPSGGINPPMFGRRIDDEEKKLGRYRCGKPNSKQPLYPDKEHQRPDNLIMERWYDNDGWAFHDRDYSDHNSPDYHPFVPHDHIFNWKHKFDFPERSSKGYEPDYESFC